MFFWEKVHRAKVIKQGDRWVRGTAIQIRETGMKRMLSRERLRWCCTQNWKKLRWNRMLGRGVGGSLRGEGTGALGVYCSTGIRESCRRRGMCES